jgi:Ca2+-binding EF-hand superfamily protein
MKDLDKDGSGQIDFDEFIQVAKLDELPPDEDDSDDGP